jgi:hypothetical protein
MYDPRPIERLFTLAVATDTPGARIAMRVDKPEMTNPAYQEAWNDAS